MNMKMSLQDSERLSVTTSAQLFKIEDFSLRLIRDNNEDHALHQFIYLCLIHLIQVVIILFVLDNAYFIII